MCGTDCWTDHRFVVSKLNLRIQPVRRQQGKKVPKKLDVSKLKQDSKRQAFVNDLCSRLDALEHSSEDVDESWTVFRDTRSLFSNGFPRTSISQTPRLVWWEWQRNSGTPCRETPKTQGFVVLPTLLYACETWTVYQRHAKRLKNFHTSCLRKLLKIKWQDKIPDTEVLKRAGMQSIHTFLKLGQLRWTGHVTRMPDELLPKKILYGEPQVEKRSHGGQKKRYKDTLKASLKDFNIPAESWEQIVQDRTKWRGLIKRGAGEYEAKRISEAEQKRAQRKARAKASPTELSFSDLSCPICNRQFRAKIGLISHLRTHK